jgi:hypothetical protein
LQRLQQARESKVTIVTIPRGHPFSSRHAIL